MNKHISKFGSTNLKRTEKFLGLMIDRNLTYNNHNKSIRKIASQKQNMLERISPCID